MKRVLVTGACGFLGRHVAAYFKKHGFCVSGIGHDHWDGERSEDYGIDHWITADVTIDNLKKFTDRFICIVHCAGGSSVGYSVISPLPDFQKTVDTAINILEYTRIFQPGAKLIFPSSAAVYGEKRDEPILETASLAPVSPYGFFKKITEELCECYVTNFGISVSVIRFFSIYGAGLRKQLLWDACTKLSADSKAVTFFGTGRETRDWLHIDDAVSLIHFMSQVEERYTVVNGGGGGRTTVINVLTEIKKLLGKHVEIIMDGSQKEGDPKHYWADIEKLKSLGWQPKKNIESSLQEYVSWFQQNIHRTDWKS